MPTIQSSRRLLISTLTICALCGSAEADDDPPYCDPTVKRAANAVQVQDSLKYRPRLGANNQIDRCEGTYGELNAKEPLLLLAIHGACPATKAPTETGRLQLDWLPVAKVENLRVRVRALSSRPYLLDAGVAVTQKTFSWSDGMLNRLEVLPSELGALAWTTLAERQVYVPVSWRAPAAACDASYHLVLAGVSNASSVDVTVKAIDGKQVVRKFNQKGAYMKGPADVPVPVDKFASGAGLYQLTLSFERRQELIVNVFHQAASP